ncbi:GDSL esterase/lipase [Trifolium repens]|nr:GDSL esterase/lipase [Trifolium repens]
MEWYFDSGCSNHMTGNRSILSNFNECLNIKIKLANNEFIKAEGMGNVMIEMSNGKKAVIENVLLVPGMQCNLLSVGKLISKGFKIVIEDETLQLFDSKKRLILKTAQSKNRTYKTQFKAIGAECPPATVDNSQVISEGIGSILVKRNDGQEASITGVLKSNVISIGQLLEKNYSVKMHDKELKLVDAKDREILKAPMSNNKTFRMLNMLEHQCVVPTVNESQNWIWHHRRKLEGRSQAMIFLGYHSAGAYKLYSPTRNKIVTCRDMQFVKAKSWSWSGNVVHQDVATSGVTSVPEKAMLVEAKPIDLDQAMNDSNWLEATKRKKYAEDILKRFKMVGCNASITLTDTMAKTEAEYVAGVFDTSSSGPNMTAQIDIFNQLIQENVYTLSDITRSIAYVSVAGNDYNHYLATNGSLRGFPSFIASVVKQTTTNLIHLQSLGFKRIVVGGLQPWLSSSMLNNPSSHNIKERLKPCCFGVSSEYDCGSVDENNVKKYLVCENPESTFFWDRLHPTQAGWNAVYNELKIKGLHQFMFCLEIECGK